jgi:hypothetical protein
MNNQINSIGFTITFQTPYNNCEWRTQSFTTKEECLEDGYTKMANQDQIKDSRM